MKKIFFIAALILFIGISPHVFAEQYIPGKQIEAMAIQEIENILKNRSEFRRREITFVRSLEDISLPNGVINIKIILPTTALTYTGITPVRAQISVNGKDVRAVNFSATLRIFDTVLVANHDLRVEVPVGKNDFRMEEVAVDGRNEYCKDISEVVGLVPLRYVRAGSPIAKSYFQQPVVVSYGTPVKIIVRYNGLNVAAKGTAMARGRIGEIIKVKNDASQKVVSGKVIDAQTVEVIY